MIRPLRWFILSAALAGGAAHAQSFNIDFGDYYGAPVSSYGAAAAQTGHWHQIDKLGLTSGLVATDGKATGASLTLTADFITGVGSNSWPYLAVDVPLMGDNFYSAQNGTWSLQLSGLVDGTYEVFLYSNTNSLVWPGSPVVNGVAMASFARADGGTLDRGLEYQSLADVVVVNGNLTVTGGGATYTGVSGMQLVSAVPEPSSVALGCLGLLFLAHRVRARRQASAG